MPSGDDWPPEIEDSAYTILGCSVVCSVLVTCRDALVRDGIGEISRGKKEKKKKDKDKDKDKESDISQVSKVT